MPSGIGVGLACMLDLLLGMMWSTVLYYTSCRHELLSNGLDFPAFVNTVLLGEFSRVYSAIWAFVSVLYCHVLLCPVWFGLV